MKCAKSHFVFTMVNADVDSKCQYDRSEILAYFESQSVLSPIFNCYSDRILEADQRLSA